MISLTAFMVQFHVKGTNAGLSTKGQKAELHQRPQATENKRQSETNTRSQKRQKMSLSADLVCPITLELPFDPVTAEDGRIYERKAIEKHIKIKGCNLRSPVTNVAMGGRLLPAPQHKNIIEGLIELGVIDGDLVSRWNDNVREVEKRRELQRKWRTQRRIAQLRERDNI